MKAEPADAVSFRDLRYERIGSRGWRKGLVKGGVEDRDIGHAEKGVACSLDPARLAGL